MYNAIVSGPADAPSVPTLARLFRKMETHTLLQIVDDESTPHCVLSMLASHPDVAVRCALAQHLTTPSSVLLTLALDEAAEVRYNLSENQMVPLCLLLLLAEDRNPYVRSRATWTINARENCIGNV